MPTVNFKQLWKLYSVSYSFNCSLYTKSSFVAVFFILWGSYLLLVFFNVSFPGMLPIGSIQRSVPRSATAYHIFQKMSVEIDCWGLGTTVQVRRASVLEQESPTCAFLFFRVPVSEEKSIKLILLPMQTLRIVCG